MNDGIGQNTHYGSHAHSPSSVKQADRGLRITPLLRFLQRVESGEDSSFEFTTLIVPMILMILLVAFATIVRASQMPIWTAASECAHGAISSETESVGRAQGTQAAMDSLQGNAIDQSSVQVLISGNWVPDSPITCEVKYNIDVHNLAFVSELTGGYVPMSAQITLRMEPYKSKWQ